MKKILGLDLGTTSIGWALVNEAENENEKSSIIKLGVRVNPITVDELTNFEKGKSITTNADRTLKRSMRRNLQRFKLRKENLIEILVKNKFISQETILSENGNKTTFETYHLRAKAATEEVTLEQFARILLMINKKRGYKSSRKVKSQDEGQLIDGMEIAKKLYNENLTPGQLVMQLLKEGKKYIPDFYRSDLKNEFDKVWNFQKQFYPEILTDEFRNEIEGKGLRVTSAAFWKKYGFNTAENKGTKEEKRYQAYNWRNKACSTQLTKEEVAFVIAEINNNLNSSSGYLGSISDRSKELFFHKMTVGQYLMKQLKENPHTRLKNQVFYRQDYLDEFNTIWETQSKYHKELTKDLKEETRDVIIFYQRRLKSQKGLISFCEYESRQVEVEIEGKRKILTVGSKVCPKSSPLFQEFKIWQILNNLEVTNKSNHNKRFLQQEEKELLFHELNLKDKISRDEALKILFENYKELDLNYKSIEGNKTLSVLFNCYEKIIELSGHGEYDFSKMRANEILKIVENVFEGLGFSTQILFFNSDKKEKELEQDAMFRLWHLLYSFEGDNSNTGNQNLIEKISNNYGFSRENSKLLASITFQNDYSSLSTKAIKKILPFLKDGLEYSKACALGGYRHSKSSLTKEEIENKVLKDKLEILPKNTLRNPVVEKILNQMVNVINAIIETYGKPDEIRIELARELKKNASEREATTIAINRITTEHENYVKILQEEFGLNYISKNDIIKYKLYLELADNGFKTLYSNTYIEPEKLFSKEFDIEHIIPQSRLFDDSFSNKTLETRSINIDKGNETAYDYISNKYGQEGLENYLMIIEDLIKKGKISKGKYLKLRMKGENIPDDFIERDIRDTQYIAKKAKGMLEEISKSVVSTTGSITDKLREDWQLVDVMQELNWEKYEKLGMTEIIENRDGQRIRKIIDWTKRNDHRHHAMDALTVAFTKRSHIQYLNNLNARSDKSGSIYGIEAKETYRDERGKIKFKPPIPLNEFRTEAKKHLESILISIKAKNKVVTKNINSTNKAKGLIKKIQLTPRGQLHLETIYGSNKKYATKIEKIGAGFDEEKIMKVAKKKYREALIKRLREYDDEPKKAFTGKNSPEKNPIWIDRLLDLKVPDKVKIVEFETIYTIRKEITPELKIDKVVDTKIRIILEKRLEEYGGDNKKAFSNLEENPIWLNKEKGISIKRVKITGISNAIPLHEKKDKNGKLLTNEYGKNIPADFVNTGNNHHVAIYRDDKGNLQENVVSFFEAVERVNQNLPIIDKNYKKDEGWEFLFSMKQNEYFVFPDEKTGFNPFEIDVFNPDNNHLISSNLFYVQTMSKVIYGNNIIRDFKFRNHLETQKKDSKVLKGITFHQFKTLEFAEHILKIRINHIGQIISIGEY